MTRLKTIVFNFENPQADAQCQTAIINSVADFCLWHVSRHR